MLVVASVVSITLARLEVKMYVLFARLLVVKFPYVLGDWCYRSIIIAKTAKRFDNSSISFFKNKLVFSILTEATLNH